MFSIQFYQDPFQLSDKCSNFMLELVDKLTKFFFPSTFEPFIGHRGGGVTDERIVFFIFNC